MRHMLCILMSNSILILCSYVLLVSELPGFFFFLLMLRTSPLKGGSDDLKRVIGIDYM